MGAVASLRGMKSRASVRAQLGRYVKQAPSFRQTTTRSGHPEVRVFHQRDEGSRVDHYMPCAGTASAHVRSIESRPKIEVGLC